MLFALDGGNLNESLGDSNKTEDSEGADFKQIFSNISNELDSESKEAADISELAELFDSQTLKLLREKLNLSSLDEKLNIGELLEQAGEITDISELAGMFDSQALEQFNESLSKLSRAETGNDVQFLKQLKQVIPSKVLLQCESADELISKLDNLKSAVPGSEDKINNLQDLLSSNSEKVSEFLKNLKSTGSSESKPAVKSNPAEIGLVPDKNTSGKASDNNASGLKSQNTSNTSTGRENIAGISRENSQTGFNFQAENRNSFANSGKNRLAEMAAESKSDGNTQNIEDALLSNKSKLDIESMKNAVKSSKGEFDFSDIQAAQLRQVSQSVKSTKQVDFTGARVTVSRQVQESIQTAVEEGIKQVKVNLNPPELGKIVINLKQHAGELTGRLEVTNPQTKIEIDKAIASVVENLKTSGLTIQKPEVVLTDNNSTNSYQQFKQQEFADSQFAGQQGEDSDGNFDRQGGNRSGQNSETVLSSAESSAGEMSDDNKIAAGSLNFLM